MLRINAGLFRGRVLRSCPDPAVRPTLNRVKLSFFDSVQEELREKIFLDGFAGTGNIGIEALSRGAEYVIFIDILGKAVRTIAHNLTKIGVSTSCYRIICGDFNRSIIALAKENFLFDMAYLDPPYQLLEYADPLKVMAKRGVLLEGGLVVLERPSNLPFSTSYFRALHQQRIGKKTLAYFRR